MRTINLLFALLLVASGAFIAVNPDVSGSIGILATLTPGITTTTTTVSTTLTPYSITTQTSTTSTTTATSSTSTSFTSTTTASSTSFTTTITKSFLNISVITIFGGTVSGTITNTIATLTTTIVQLTTSTITTTGSTTSTSTQIVPFPIGIPGFPAESVALGLLLGILALMLLRRKAQFKHRRR